MMNPGSASGHRYHAAKHLHRTGHQTKGSSERRQRRLLGVVKVIAIIFIVTGILTTVVGSILIVFAFGEPRFTFSTGLPLMIGILEFLGSFIVSCISMTGTRFRRYTSPKLCKWQCALLCFCHLGVLVLGTASLVLTFTFKTAKYSLIRDSSVQSVQSVHLFPLGLGSTVLIAFDLLGVLGSLLFFCIFKERCGPEACSRHNASLQHNAHTEQEIHYRMLALRSLLSRYATDHVVLPHRTEVTSSHMTHRNEPQVDRKGYYVWEPV